MAAGAVTAVVILRHTLVAEVGRTAEMRAADVANLLRAGADPDTLVAEQHDPEDSLLQVVDEDGNVVAASPNMAGRPAVTRLNGRESAEVRVPFEDDRFLAVALETRTPRGRRLTVIVARSRETVDDSAGAVGDVLAVGLPILLVMVGMTTWKATGRALAPVESIRRQVDEISAAALHRRVPDPRGDDEIARLARTMNRMLDRLERASTRQRRFISDASHELRSPVASIRQHAEVALAHPNRTTTAELAETVLAEDLRVQRLVEDLLLLARADEHTLQLHRRPVDLDDLVFDEARRLREQTRLRVETTGVSAGRVEGDAAGLRRVLRNLGDNAARHARGAIRFSLAERDGAVVLAVEDDGPGIPQAERERVLERFVRLDDARARDAGGSGLGLAIVAELTTAHSGTVGITSGGLGGARVELRLPAVQGGT